jgi:hypothetical protein
MGAQPYFFIFGSPVWVWVGALIVLVTAVMLFISIYFPRLLPKADRRVELGDTVIELWARERRMPGGARGIVVPSAPDLKMATGISKWVRDATANAVQYEALKVAPLQPGEAFVGSGGRYRFGNTAIAVVMDDQKRTTPEWIRNGVRNALVMLRARDADTVLVPDMTEDLLRQPKWISDEQRRETCRPIARAIMEGVLEGSEDINVVKIWAWRGNKDIWIEEMDRIAGHAEAGHAAPATA